MRRAFSLEFANVLHHDRFHQRLYALNIATSAVTMEEQEHDTADVALFPELLLVSGVDMNTGSTKRPAAQATKQPIFAFAVLRLPVR